MRTTALYVEFRELLGKDIVKSVKERSLRDVKERSLRDVKEPSLS